MSSTGWYNYLTVNDDNILCLQFFYMITIIDVVRAKCENEVIQLGFNAPLFKILILKKNYE